MPQRFDDIRTQPARALQIWMILIGKAHNRQTMTYGELARLMSFKASGTLGSFLDPVMRYCRLHNLPALTVLVVNQDTGLPGQGMPTDRDLHAAREQVYRFDWYGLVPPSPEDFAEALQHSITDM